MMAARQQREKQGDFWFSPRPLGIISRLPRQRARSRRRRPGGRRGPALRLVTHDPSHGRPRAVVSLMIDLSGSIREGDSDSAESASESSDTAQDRRPEPREAMAHGVGHEANQGPIRVNKFKISKRLFQSPCRFN